MAAAKQLVDPISKYVYTATDEGLVEVLDPATGQSGLFDENAVWQSGELRYANRQLAGWIGRLAVRRAAAARAEGGDG
jgi:hypothetical protein